MDGELGIRTLFSDSLTVSSHGITIIINSAGPLRPCRSDGPSVSNVFVKFHKLVTMLVIGPEVHWSNLSEACSMSGLSYKRDYEL